MIDIKRILVPVDFSDSSSKAIRYGAEFAQRFGAELILVHILELPFYPVEQGLGMVPPGMPDEVIPEVESRLAEERAAAGVDAAIAVRLIVREGKPFVELIRLAREESVDLIIIPTHGRTGLPHLLIGSTAERVATQATCPVLVMRDQERDFVMP